MFEPTLEFSFVTYIANIEKENLFFCFNIHYKPKTLRSENPATILVYLLEKKSIYIYIYMFMIDFAKKNHAWYHSASQEAIKFSGRENSDFQLLNLTLKKTQGGLPF